MEAPEQITDEYKQKYRHNRIKGKTEYFSHKITPKSYSEVILAQKSKVYNTEQVKNYHICKKSAHDCERIYGEDEWARTTDPLHVKQVL